MILYWQDVAPDPQSRVKPQFDETDPAAYDWTAYEAAIDGARARGMRVLLTVTGPVPRWATNGARDNVTRPSPNEFQQFMQAVGRHYGGRVEAFSIWNEPNQPQFLAPAVRQPQPAGVAADLPRARVRSAARARARGPGRQDGAPRRDLAASAPRRSSRR